MKTGANTLVTIAALAPFVGLAGTVVGLLDALRGGSNTPTGWLIFYGNSIALSLVPTALGLLVGVVSVSSYNHLIRRIELFDVDSTTAVAIIEKQLEADPTCNVGAELPFGSHVADWEATHDTSGVLLTSVWLVWLYVVAAIGWMSFGSLH
ncbi:MAG: MotA/TolQ/ExbB proton channel family protein [Acidobacteria bacterium]|nr:MotA/TolQ/ExbB proton channel family protein [Acidobacteriota bacterium]